MAFLHLSPYAQKVRSTTVAWRCSGNKTGQMNMRLARGFSRLQQIWRALAKRRSEHVTRKRRFPMSTFVCMCGGKSSFPYGSARLRGAKARAASEKVLHGGAKCTKCALPISLLSAWTLLAISRSNSEP